MEPNIKCFKLKNHLISQTQYKDSKTWFKSYHNTIKWPILSMILTV